MAHWSTPAHFWAGVIGMFVNNFLALFGVWAMLFAGKPELAVQCDAYLVLNLLTMLTFGLLHVFLGGLTELDKQVVDGGLDSVLVSSRNPLLMMSITQSHLPSWGDVLMGGVGLVILGVRGGFVFSFELLLMVICSFIGFACVFTLLGCVPFWFSRPERLNPVLINVVLAFNTYPALLDYPNRFRWFLVLGPVAVVGLIPTEFLSHPSLSVLALEVLGVVMVVSLTLVLFSLGLKRYQSTPMISLRRGA